ncbi:replication factor A [Halodesulfurarchaeum sp. HSR-GB]|uniref:replication factor A n=1 Tax=Halodesulfurarchaeum sp. HSR-GB TaxID=3074077 RepID=UPI00285B5319|nr:replication factor A [Halodesulfurarchaeum sp. HSR-GB]MDR5657638.1 replication factor A [Halodesulfurarchaeum sp. HSR-GB]
MSDNNTSDLVEDVVELFDEDVSIDPEAVEQAIEKFRGEYKIPQDELRPLLVSQFQDKHDIADEELFGDSDPDEFDPISLSEMEEIYETAQANGQNAWVDVIVKFTQAWEPNTDSIQNVGLVADGTGQTKLTVWSNKEFPVLEEGETYRLENVVIEEYQGDLSLSSTPNSTIEVAEESIEDTNTFEGVILELNDTSGLIKRCPEDECSRVVTDGRCSVHGNVEGEFDLRVKAILDNGFDSRTVYLDADLTEEVTGIDLETAEQKAQDALDVSVVRNEMEEMLVGRYLEVTGSMYDNNIFVDEAEFQIGPREEDVDAIEQLA